MKAKFKKGDKVRFTPSWRRMCGREGCGHTDRRVGKVTSVHPAKPGYLDVRVRFPGYPKPLIWPGDTLEKV